MIVCVIRGARHLDRLGQLGELELVCCTPETWSLCGPPGAEAVVPGTAVCTALPALARLSARLADWRLGDSAHAWPIGESRHAWPIGDSQQREVLSLSRISSTYRETAALSLSLEEPMAKLSLQVAVESAKLVRARLCYSRYMASRARTSACPSVRSW